MKAMRGWILMLVIGTGVFVMPATRPAWAETGIVDVGNTVCPVSGDKVSGKHFVEYKGKRYALCCPLCEKDFKKDPEKFIAQLEAGKAHEPAGHSH